MMNRFKLCIIFLFIFVIPVCQAQLRCYVCNTLPGGLHSEKCGDDFRLTSVDASNCPTGTCQKTRAIRDEGGRQVVEITRGCVTYQGEGCRTGTHLGVTADICTCNEQLCNSAEGKTNMTKQALLLSGLMMTLCHLFIKLL